MDFLDLTFWSVVPPLVTIALAIITREILLSLSIGVILGVLLKTHFVPLEALKLLLVTLAGTTDEDGNFVAGAITDPDNCMLLLVIILIGGMLGLLVKSGGSQAFANLLIKKINTKSKAGILTCVLGSFMFVDDYFDLLINGTINKEICDKNKMAREKLTYYLDSVTAAACQLSPISSWAAFVCSMLGASLVSAGIDKNTYMVYLSSIPNNFFAIASIVMLFSVAIFGINIGPMRKAELRAETTGKLWDNTFSGSDEDDFASLEISKGQAKDLIIPIAILITSVVLFMMQSGGFFQHHSVVRTVNEMDGIPAILSGFICSIIITVIYLNLRKLATVGELINAIITGFKSMFYALCVLSLGWTLGSISESMGIADFMISLFGDTVPVFLIPALLLLICSGMTFAIGGGWTTYAVMTPVIVPFALATGADLSMCLSAMVAAGALGALCSPLADTSIVASMSGGIAILDHVKTQIPYAAICGVMAVIAYIAKGLTGSLLIAYAALAIMLFITIFILTRVNKKARI
ncbi:MAG: Na+/H+ antiporter NhaC family protein [Firmicutes bacterium]|nr:Na+/H+ antiporter NhaC family protein [Bacillota bacterium]